MKVIHLCHHFSPCIGGVEKTILEYCKGLSENGFEQKIVCLNKCPNSDKILKQKEKIENIEVERIPYTDLKYYKFAPKAWGKIKDSDVIHLHGLTFFSDLFLYFVLSFLCAVFLLLIISTNSLSI